MQFFRMSMDRTSRVLVIVMALAMGLGVGLLASTAHEHTPAAHTRKLMFFALWAIATAIGAAGAIRQNRKRQHPADADDGSTDGAR